MAELSQEKSKKDLIKRGKIALSQLIGIFRN
jgi:hypothetical protein